MQRGIPPFETATRNTLDLSCIPVIKQEFHLPIIIHPGHETGHWNLAADERDSKVHRLRSCSLTHLKLTRIARESLKIEKNF